MQQKHSSDWMAYILIVLIFAALLTGILVVGTGLELPFLNSP